MYAPLLVETNILKKHIINNCSTIPFDDKMSVDVVDVYIMRHMPGKQVFKHNGKCLPKELFSCLVPRV